MCLVLLSRYVEEVGESRFLCSRFFFFLVVFLFMSIPMGIFGVLPVVIVDSTILVNPKCKNLFVPLHLITTVLLSGSLGVVVVVVDSSNVSGTRESTN